MSSRNGALDRRATAVMIGGGVTGLATAYELALQGVTDVVVLEQKYIPYGASGRNGGGVRAQWTTPETIALAKASIERFEGLSAELDFNVWFRQGGYLFLAFGDDHMAAVERAVAFQNRHGVPSRVVDPDEAQVIVPDLHAPGLLGASYCPIDGVIFPWSVVHGYWRRLKEMGVRVHTFTEVTGLTLDGGRVTTVHTSRGDVDAEWVVNCAGAWSPRVSEMAGAALPNTPVRHEIMVTEALTPFLDPMLVDLSTGMYVSQDMRGECVGGMGDPREPEGINFGSSFAFAKRMARRLTELLPVMGRVRMLRQWSGMYDTTPDHKPNLGPTPGVENLLQANGFSGHGFMISPMVSRATADLILGNRPPVDLKPFSLERFATGELAEPEGLVIG